MTWPGVLRRFQAQLAVGVTLRIAWLVAVARPPRLVWADPWQYVERARLVTEGQWGTSPPYPLGSGRATSFLSVGYPGLIGAISRVTSVGPWRVALGLNLLASAALIVGLGVLTQRLAGPRAGVMAAWIVALFPDLITSTSLVMTELVAGALIVGVMVALLRPQPRWWHIAIALAALVWIRPSLQLLLLAIPIVLWRLTDWRQAARVLAFSAALMTPLLVHSTVRVGGGIGLTTATWINICEGAATDPGTPWGDFATSQRCDAGGVSEAEWANKARTAALDAIGDRPIRWIALIPFRLWHSFELGGWGIQVAQEWAQNMGTGSGPTAVLRASQGAFILVVLAGIVGAFRLRRESGFQLVALFAAVSLSGALVSFGQPRFGLPTMLLVLIPAASAVLSTSAIGAGRAWR